MIGVFDSGMGGLTVWQEIKKLLPNESLLYFGDGAHCPYGPKPADEVLQYIDEAIAILIKRGAKMVVLACNTATVIAVAHLRAKYPHIPIVGMEPAIKPAVETTKSGVVGVLATYGTIHSKWFREKVCKYSDKARIVYSVGEGWVKAIEAGESVDVRPALQPLLDAGVDRIVLGCTHYPFLRAEIEQLAGKGVEIIDPAGAVARRVKWLLNERGIEARADETPTYDFMTFGDEQYRQKLIEKANNLIL